MVRSVKPVQGGDGRAALHCVAVRALNVQAVSQQGLLVREPTWSLSSSCPPMARHTHQALEGRDQPGINTSWRRKRSAITRTLLQRAVFPRPTQLHPTTLDYFNRAVSLTSYMEHQTMCGLTYLFVAFRPRSAPTYVGAVALAELCPMSECATNANVY